MYLKYNKLFDVLEATHIQRRIALLAVILKY